MEAIVVRSTDRGFFFARTLEPDNASRSVFVHQNDVIGQRFLRPDDRIEIGEIVEPKDYPGKLQGKQVKFLARMIVRQLSENQAATERKEPSNE